MTINIPVISIKISTNPGASTSHSINRPTYSLQDVDGDGYLDIVESEKESELKVTRSAIGRTNMLKSVTNSLGGTFTLDYAHTTPTYGLPGGKWVMSALTIDDGIHDDGPVMTTAFEYKDGKRDRHERGDRKTLAVFISQSGTTEEIVEGLRKARNQGFMTVGVCNQREDNPLGMEADYVVDYHAEAMWECQLVALYTLIARMALERGESTETMEKILSDMKRLPEVLGHHIENFEAKAMEMTKPLRNLKGFYTVSASSMVPLAYKEGVITGMEFLWSHGAVIQAGEFRHGPLEIVESGVPFLFLVPTDSSRVITQRALKFVEKWKGTVIVLDYADFAMGLHDDLAPFVMFVPLEWFCYYFSIVRDHNPDDRRYYGVVEY